MRSSVSKHGYDLKDKLTKHTFKLAAHFKKVLFVILSKKGPFLKQCL